MDDKKICIIFDANQKNEISKLIIPDGYEIEIRSIANTNNITKAYNEILNSSDAKYKIYINQLVSFQNKNILFDVIKIFLENRKIGMLGIIGTETIPTSGIWQESTNKYGKYYYVEKNNKKEIIERNIKEEYKKVKVIGSAFMATQYDVRWREELFDDMYFYDTAQCIEFIKLGYEIVVPRQDESWCTINKKYKVIPNKFEEYNEIFLKEYSKDIFPLVSILIATYNRPNYFKIALESAINQSYKNIEIIVGDDSTNNETQNVIKPYIEKYKNIKYYSNGGPLGNYGVNNGLKCFKLSNGEFVNYLMDDDVFHKDKIKKMMNYFIENKKISLVTSYRKVIDKDGNEKEDIAPTKKLLDSTGTIKGNQLIQMIFHSMTNIVGEPTTVLFRKKDIADCGFGNYRGKQYISIIDVASWINLLLKGDAVYISEALSYFRIHEGQNENRVELICNGLLEWFNLIIEYSNNEKLINYKQVVARWIYLFICILSDEDKSSQFKIAQKIKLYECYNYAIKKVLDIKLK